MRPTILNIGILGGGTAGAINLVALLYSIKQPTFSRSQLQLNITCIHDPKIPVAQVGESVTPGVCFTLLDALKFSMLKDLETVDGTLRFGARYFWEEANGLTFDIPYTSPGIHVNSEKFSYRVLEMALKEHPDMVTLKLDHIKEYSQDENSVTVIGDNETYTFDYVINCMGTPSNEELASDAYARPDVETVNSVILYPDFTQTNEMYTSSYVHKNGWMFGVPLSHRKAYGYLYNSDITTTSEAEKHFSELKGIDTTALRKISWSHYYRKKVINQRVITSGNRLFFFEPHQTLPLHIYNMLAVDFLEKVINTHNDLASINKEMNKRWTDIVQKMQDLIAINYAGECQIESDFWKTIGPKAKQRLRDSDKFQSFIDSCSTSIQKFFVHPPKVMTEYIEGYKIDLEELRRK
jgi:hypothetical protein